jgi:hypothetical protein
MKEKTGLSSEVDKRKGKDGNEMKGNQFQLLFLL